MTGDLDRALSVLDEGGLIVYPTDTLWALGARLDRPEAIRRVFETKGRSFDQPLSLAVASVEDIDAWAVVTPVARRLFPLLPGPLTLVLERRPSVPDAVVAGRDTVGVRVPNHRVALELLARSGPLTCTSANRHGEPDPSTLEDARRHLGDRAGYYLPSPTRLLGAPSTLLDARTDPPRLLRAGVLDDAEIRRRLAE